MSCTLALVASQPLRSCTVARTCALAMLPEAVLTIDALGGRDTEWRRGGRGTGKHTPSDLRGLVRTDGVEVSTE
jgi:hypothetical protein